MKNIDLYLEQAKNNKNETCEDKNKFYTCIY